MAREFLRAWNFPAFGLALFACLFCLLSTAFGAPIETVSVPAGAFAMGRSGVGDDKFYGSSSEMPTHTVTLAAYQIGKYEVTNRQYCDVLNWALGKGYLRNENGGAYSTGTVYAYGQALVYLYASHSYSECQIVYAGGFTWKSREGAEGVIYSMAEHPVVGVTWQGAVAFCNWMSEKEGLEPSYNLASWQLIPSRKGYRLPTEAEWERAAAWGNDRHWVYGFQSDAITSGRSNYTGSVDPLGLSQYPLTSPVGWFNGSNISPHGHVPTQNSPSPVGAYDMSGNVWEWCQDWYHASYAGAPTDGSSWETQESGSPYRVIRGGSWHKDWVSARSACRAGFYPSDYWKNDGFRVCLGWAPRETAALERWMVYE